MSSQWPAELKIFPLWPSQPQFAPKRLFQYGKEEINSKPLGMEEVLCPHCWALDCPLALVPCKVKGGGGWQVRAHRRTVTLENPSCSHLHLCLMPPGKLGAPGSPRARAVPACRSPLSLVMRPTLPSQPGCRAHQRSPVGHIQFRRAPHQNEKSAAGAAGADNLLSGGPLAYHCWSHLCLQRLVFLEKIAWGMCSGVGSDKSGA